MDAWMLRRTGELVRECREWYDAFEFHRVYHRLHDFCTVDLSALYFDILKDRLYTFAPNNRGRRSAQTAIYRIASALLHLIAPTLVFTAEEVWKHLPKRANAPESVHMSSVSRRAGIDRRARRETQRRLGSHTCRSRRSAEGARAGARGKADFERSRGACYLDREERPRRAAQKTRCEPPWIFHRLASGSGRRRKRQ